MTLFKVPVSAGAVTVVLLSALVDANAGDDTMLARVEDILDRTDTLSAHFTQVLMDDSGQVVAASDGSMAIRKPGRFRWHYTSPEELLVIGDGDRIWSYDVELENVTVAAQADALDGNPAALLAGGGSAADAFAVVGAWQAGETDWIELEPTAAERDFRSVRLGFAGDALVAMELHDQLGQTTRIEFDDLERNGPVDDALFRFTPPEGVDVISAGGLSP